MLPSTVLSTAKRRWSRTLEDFENKTIALIEEIDFDAIEDKVNQSLTMAFADMYTEEELKTLISFYQSPIGKQIIKIQPKLVKAMLLIRDEVEKEILPKIDEQLRMQEQSDLGSSPVTELVVEIVGEGQGKSVQISQHPDESFNGEYKVQEGLINAGLGTRATRIVIYISTIKPTVEKRVGV